MHVDSAVVALTTAVGGAVTAYTPAANGRLIGIIYTKTDFADTVDFAITGETSGQTLWTEANVTASKTVAPRQATHANDGTASLFVAAGEPVEGMIGLPGERIKIAITNGGDAKTGSIRVIIEGTFTPG